MRIGSLKPSTQITLSIVIPLLCILLGALLIWPSANGIAKANREIVSINEEIKQKEDLIDQAEKAAGGRPLAIAVATAHEEEPIEFLRQLAHLAEESGVVLAAVRATTPPPLANPNGGQQTSGPAAGARPTTALGGERPIVPPSVREMTDQVTLEGTFGEILELIVRLEKFDRILSVSKCRITVGGAVKYPKVQAVFTLSRFVATPQIQPAAPAGATPPTAAR
jgi:hypothetical protein